jgi:ATP-dependent RNA helicase RhlE
LSFHSLGLDARLVRAIDELGFANPTPIQIGAIPPALQGKDLLACAMTGSGKTAAFMLPVLNRLLANPRRATRALVLTPTRELAAQIVEATQDFARHTSLKVAPIFGGVGHKPQEMAFRDKVDIIVACPGRLLDHFKENYGVLPDLEVLVLDEADRMLDMGFLPDLRRVLRHLPPRQQTLFFSATMPPPIAQLTREMLKDPIAIDVERQAKPATGVEQALFPVPSHLKGELIKRLIEQEQVRDAIVFTRTKHRADRLAKQLNSAGITAERIHGNRSQAQRVAALAGFKDGKFRVLVATDIAHAIPLAVVAGTGYIVTGLIAGIGIVVDPWMLASMLLGSIPTIIAGSFLARRVKPRAIQIALASVLLFVAISAIFPFAA